MFKDLVKSARSYRRFIEDEKISKEDLLDIIDTARFTASGGNNQPLRYRVVNDADTCNTVFGMLKWAAYFKDWEGPSDGQKPVSYIVVCAEQGKNTSTDEGIRSETMVLAAMEKGIGSCILANIDRAGLKTSLKIPDPYEVKLVIAMGYPAEEIVTDEIGADGDVKYYRDDKDIHHVPKISLDDQLI